MFRGAYMMRRTLLALFVVSIFARTSFSYAETSQAVLDTTKSTSHTEAEKIHLQARAERGDADAQMWLGAAYEQGWFGDVDSQQALKWFKKSAAHNNADAQFSLGQMYEDGTGVRQNYREAAKWYRKAAEHVPDYGGAGQGRNGLGLLYLKGLGVPKDYVQAHLWFSLSPSQTNLSYAKAEMSPSQISEAERLVQRWKEQHPTP